MGEVMEEGIPKETEDNEGMFNLVFLKMDGEWVGGDKNSGGDKTDKTGVGCGKNKRKGNS
jgi:hypothetical protein